jgi:peptide/nickel transport system permease protein
MPRLIAKRLAAGVLTLWVASVLIFLAMNVLPGNAATAALGREVTPQAQQQLSRELGLNQPVLTRYGHWAWGVLQGHLGKSVVNSVPVTALIKEPLAHTGILLLVTLVLLVPLALLLGIGGALARRGGIDAAVQAVMLIFAAVPEFVVGTVLILLFSILWPVLPSVALSVTPGTLALPVVTLLLVSLGYLARMVRAGVREVLDSPHVAMARLKGLPERTIIRRHVLPNCLGPSAQALAATIAWLAGGIVIVEELFAYPGIGQALVDAVQSRDAPTVEALTLLIAAVYIVGNLAADIVSILSTPRLRSRL